MTHLAVHSSKGLQFTDGAPPFDKNSSKLNAVEGKVKCFAYSACGTRFAWLANGEITVVDSLTGEKLGSPKHPRAQEMCFSPKGSYLAVWDSFIKTKDQSQVQPNLSVYDVAGKKLLRSFLQPSQVNWQPQWTADESIMARNITSEVHFFKADDLANMESKKVLAKLRSFSLSPSINTHYVTFFMPSVQGSPAYIHLYRYPNFKEANQALANKSFFKVDSVETFWNKQCTACLFLTGAEMDKSGKSYYGEHMLFYMSIKGDSARITFNKPGNIHSVAWCPSGKEYFVVYGTMPANVTLFNQKCDAVAEFGSGARNTVLVNSVGNIALIGGFGNIAARFEMWDIANRKKIGETECSDTTHMSWSPCGQYLMTATCSPRLRVNNGYKIWHYTAVLQHEKLEEELYASQYIANPELAKPFTINTKPVQGIQSKIAMASKQRYVPPSQRSGPVGMPGLPGVPGMPAVSTKKKFLSQMEDPAKTEGSNDLVGLPKSAQKNKKKSAGKKKEEAKEAKRGKNWRDNQVEITEAFPDPDKDKKIRNVKKKLDTIAKLKADQEGGKELEPHQLNKIAAEDILLKELEDLSV